MNPQLRSAITHIKTSERELFWQILIVFILPIILISTKIIPISRHVLVLGILVCILFFVLLSEKWNLKMLGLRTDTIKKYFAPYAIFTAVLVLLITQFGEIVTKQDELTHWWTHHHFLYLFFVVSALQEVAYRGYLMPALGKLTKNPFTLIVANAVIFTFLHTIFPDLYTGLPVAFLGGIGFAFMYYRYPNLPLIIICHSILNFYIVLYGFFVIPGITY